MARQQLALCAMLLLISTSATAQPSVLGTACEDGQRCGAGSEGIQYGT